MYKNTYNLRGFSLLEILIALVMGLLLLLCVFQVFLSVRSLSIANAKSVKFQNNIRFITYILRRTLSMAGYAGCGQLKNLDLKNNTDFDFTADKIIRGFSSNNLPRELKKYQIVPNTDVIVIKKTGDDVANIEKNIKVGDKSFYAPLNSVISASNKTFLLADCLNADLVTVLSSKNRLVRVRDKIAHKYARAVTTASTFTEISYFISTRTVATDSSSAYGLFYAVNYGNKELLSDNINAMQIRYGVGVKNVAVVNNYYTAAQVEAKKIWNKVNSVIITLTQQGADYKTSTWDVYIKLRQRAL